MIGRDPRSVLVVGSRLTAKGKKSGKNKCVCGKINPIKWVYRVIRSKRERTSDKLTQTLAVMGTHSTIGSREKGASESDKMGWEKKVGKLCRQESATETQRKQAWAHADRRTAKRRVDSHSPTGAVSDTLWRASGPHWIAGPSCHILQEAVLSASGAVGRRPFGVWPSCCIAWISLRKRALYRLCAQNRIRKGKDPWGTRSCAKTKP